MALAKLEEAVDAVLHRKRLSEEGLGLPQLAVESQGGAARLAALIYECGRFDGPDEVAGDRSHGSTRFGCEVRLGDVRGVRAVRVRSAPGDELDHAAREIRI